MLLSHLLGKQKKEAQGDRHETDTVYLRYKNASGKTAFGALEFMPRRFDLTSLHQGLYLMVTVRLMSTFKTALLLIVFTQLIIFNGYLIGGRKGVTFAIIMALIMNLGAHWFSDKNVPAIYRAKKTMKETIPVWKVIPERDSKLDL